MNGSHTLLIYMETRIKSYILVEANEQQREIDKTIEESNKEWKINYWYKHIDKVYNYDIILI